MVNYSALTELIDKKHSFFVEYQAYTQKMLEESEEGIEVLTEKRQALIAQIDALDAQILACGSTEAEQQTIVELVKNRCSWENLSVQEQEIFQKSQNIFQIANTIRFLDEQALDKVEQMRSTLQQKIKATNNKPKIAQYFKNYEQNNDGYFLPSRFQNG